MNKWKKEGKKEKENTCLILLCKRALMSWICSSYLPDFTYVVPFSGLFFLFPLSLYLDPFYIPFTTGSSLIFPLILPWPFFLNRFPMHISITILTICIITYTHLYMDSPYHWEPFEWKTRLLFFCLFLLGDYFSKVIA